MDIYIENTSTFIGILVVTLAWLVSSFFGCSVMNSVANILRLPELFPLETDRPGLLVVEFVFKMVSLLLDACLTDEGLIELSQDSTSLWLIKSQDMEIDEKTGSDEKLQSLNNIMAIEMIAEFLRDTVISRLLYLVFSNR